MEKHACILDVRQLPSAVKHRTIFEVWNALPIGASMLIINDHDPKPLYYQLAAEYPGQFTWVYEAEGPIQWRVEIHKTETDKTFDES